MKIIYLQTENWLKVGHALRLVIILLLLLLFNRCDQSLKI